MPATRWQREAATGRRAMSRAQSPRAWAVGGGGSVSPDCSCPGRGMPARKGVGEGGGRAASRVAGRGGPMGAGGIDGVEGVVASGAVSGRAEDAAEEEGGATCRNSGICWLAGWYSMTLARLPCASPSAAPSAGIAFRNLPRYALSTCLAIASSR